MKRSLLLSTIVGVAAVIALVYGLRSSGKSVSGAVTALLPRETVVFVHVPDLKRTREDWFKSDVYRLYAEPTVQEFLRNPLARGNARNSFSQTLEEIEQLDPKDLFLAVTSVANNIPTIALGFRFLGTAENAEKMVGRWRDQVLQRSPEITRSTVEHFQHRIEITSAGPSSLALTHAGQWFLAATDTEEVKAMLDRLEGRKTDAQALLSGDEIFRGAMNHMPASYTVCFYLQPKPVADKVAAIRSKLPPEKFQRQFGVAGTLIEQIRCICSSTRFDSGKMRDVLFVDMPKQPIDGELARKSVALGTRETFLYTAGVMNLSRQFAVVDPAMGSNVLGRGLQKIQSALAAAGMTPNDWNATFGSEVAALADWSQSSHWPTLLVTCPVKDAARARKVIELLARNLDHDGAWSATEKDGVHYISMPYKAGFLSLRPTIAVSDRLMVAGLDLAAVAAAMQRGVNSSGDLASSPAYKNAAREVPEPENFFTYLDLDHLYTRLDATVRPMLLMSAAFMPWTSNYVDVGNLPPPEIITKHLSPIVSSQKYSGRGYISESVGPVTLNQAGLGAVALAVAVGRWRQRQAGGRPFNPLGAPSVGAPAAPPLPTPSPTGTP